MEACNNGNNFFILEIRNWTKVIGERKAGSRLDRFRLQNVVKDVNGRGLFEYYVWKMDGCVMFLFDRIYNFPVTLKLPIFSV